MQGSCGSHLQAELRAGRSVRLCYRLQHGDQCCSHKFVILDHEYTCQGLVLLAPLPAPVSTSRWRCGRGHDETNLVSLNVRRLSAYESALELAPIGVPTEKQKLAVESGVERLLCVIRKILDKQAFQSFFFEAFER